MYILSQLAARSARNEPWIHVDRLCGACDFGCNFLDDSYHAGYPYLWVVDAHRHADWGGAHTRSYSADARGAVAQGEVGCYFSRVRHDLSLLWLRSSPAFLPRFLSALRSGPRLAADFFCEVDRWIAENFQAGHARAIGHNFAGVTKAGAASGAPTGTSKGRGKSNGCGDFKFQI